MKKQQNVNQEQTTNGEEILQTEPAPEKSFQEMYALIREKFETAERLKTETKNEILRRIAEKEAIVSEAVKEMGSAEIAGDIDLCTQVKERTEDAEGFIKFYVKELEAIVAGKRNMCKPGEVEQLAREALNAVQRELDIITEKWIGKIEEANLLSIDAYSIIEQYRMLETFLHGIDKSYTISFYPPINLKNWGVLTYGQNKVRHAAGIYP